MVMLQSVAFSFFLSPDTSCGGINMQQTHRTIKTCLYLPPMLSKFEICQSIDQSVGEVKYQILSRQLRRILV